MPCEECGGLPCREGCVIGPLQRLFAMPTCAHDVVLADPCEDCAKAYRASCEANRVALGIA